MFQQPDQRARAAQRDFQAAGSLEEAAAFFHEGLRAGLFSEERVDLLAHLGFEPAQALSGQGPLPRARMRGQSYRLPAAPEEAEVQLLAGFDQVVIRWESPLPDARVFCQALQELSQLGPRQVWLDLGRARRIDSTCLGRLVTLGDDCRERGGEAVVTHASYSVSTVIQMLGLTAFFRLSEEPPPEQPLALPAPPQARLDLGGGREPQFDLSGFRPREPDLEWFRQIGRWGPAALALARAEREALRESPPLVPGEPPPRIGSRREVFGVSPALLAGRLILRVLSGAAL